MKVKSYSLMVLLLVFLGCDCNEDNTEPLTGLIIYTGQVCGMCGGFDSLTVAATKTYFQFRGRCSTSDPKLKTIDTEWEAWRDLVVLFDWDQFTAINVNTCEACLDACDTWISVENDGERHRIRFADDSPEIEAIKPFIDKLEAYREEVARK